MLAGAMAGCAPLPHRDWQDDDGIGAVAAARPSADRFASANATSERRVDIADRIWRTIVARYYLPDLNGIDVATIQARTIADVATVTNDAAFYDVLSRDLDALGDSHTGILTPGRVEELRTRRGVRFGIAFGAIEGRVVVTDVEAGSATDEAGIRAGMVIEAIDDEALDQVFFDRSVGHPPETGPIDEAVRASRVNAAVQRLLLADRAAGVAHRIVLLRGDDSRWETWWVAREGDLLAPATYRSLPSGVGVLRIPSLENELRPSIVQGIDRARADARALIVDLRGNAGGTDTTLRTLLGELVARPMPVVRMLLRPALWYWPDRLSVEPVRHPYLAPLAVVVDAGTGSAAEIAALVLVEQRAALVVGEDTCGCVVGVIGKYVLPDGGALRVAEIGFESVNGRRLEGDPLHADLPVRATLADWRAARDVIIEAAEKALLDRLDATSSHASATP